MDDMTKISTKEFIDRMSTVNPSVAVIGEYINAKTKIKVKGTVCGHEWMVTPSDLLRGHGCPKCRYINNSNRMRKSNDQFIQELRRINPDIEPLDTYQTSQIPIRVRCKVCAYEWQVKPNTLMNGSGCAQCAGLRKKTTDEFITELSSKNSNVVVLGKYRNNRAKIRVRCLNCGHEWNPSPKSLLMGRSCPECSKVGTSFMEQFILAAFVKVLGDEQVVNRNKDAIGLELDIFIPSKLLAIEPGSWFRHEENFERDKQKRSVAKKVGIRLITIYDSYPERKSKPYEDDCYVFSGELNEPGYQRLKKLVLDLYNDVGITTEVSDEFWNSIIDSAHKGTARISHEEFVARLASISPTIKIVGKYRSARDSLSVQCTRCGHEWAASPGRLLNGSGCIVCAGLVKKTTAIFAEEIAMISPEIEILEEYVNSKSKIRVRSKNCGHTWDALPSSLLQGHKCPNCAGNTKKTHSQFTEELRKINPSLTVSGKYIDAKTKIAIICNNCGKVFYMTPNALLNGHGCKECNFTKGNRQKKGKTHLKTTGEFVSELSGKNPLVEVLGEYSYSKSPIQVKCKSCGHEWAPQAGSLLQGHGCPICGKTKAVTNRGKS